MKHCCGCIQHRGHLKPFHLLKHSQRLTLTSLQVTLFQLPTSDSWKLSKCNILDNSLCTKVKEKFCRHHPSNYVGISVEEWRHKRYRFCLNDSIYQQLPLSVDGLLGQSIIIPRSQFVLWREAILSKQYLSVNKKEHYLYPLILKQLPPKKHPFISHSTIVIITITT